MGSKLNKVIVVKLGGSIFDNKDTTISDIVRLQKQGRQLVVVHGGANIVTQWLTKLGIPTRFVHGERITDEATCYKAFKSDVSLSMELSCERFEFCPEVTAKVLKGPYSFMEVPIFYEGRSVEEGKKIGWRDAVEAITTLVKYRFKK